MEVYEGQFGNKLGYLDNVLQNKVRAANPRNPTALELEESQHVLRDNMMAALLVLGADNLQYCALKMELRNLYTQGQDNYPRTMAKALNILNRYKNPTARYFGRGGNAGGVTFALVQQDKNKTKQPNRRGQCYACRQKGHFAWESPTSKEGKDNKDTVHMNTDNDKDGEDQTRARFVHFAFFQRYRYRLNPEHIHLDMCSIFSQVMRREYLKDLCKVDKGVTAY